MPTPPKHRRAPNLRAALALPLATLALALPTPAPAQPPPSPPPLAPTPPTQPPQPAATVQITITNIASARGQIRVAICPRADFLHPHCPYQAQTPAHPGAVTLTLQNIPPGTYAAQAFHDLNNNNRLDRTFLGLPAEPMGFSNNAPLRFGPPSFVTAAFPVTAPLTRLTFALRAY